MPFHAPIIKPTAGLVMVLLAGYLQHIVSSLCLKRYCKQDFVRKFSMFINLNLHQDCFRIKMKSRDCPEERLRQRRPEIFSSAELSAA